MFYKDNMNIKNKKLLGWLIFVIGSIVIAILESFLFIKIGLIIMLPAVGIVSGSILMIILIKNFDL